MQAQRRFERLIDIRCDVQLAHLRRDVTKRHHALARREILAVDLQCVHLSDTGRDIQRKLHHKPGNPVRW